MKESTSLDLSAVLTSLFSAAVASGVIADPVASMYLQSSAPVIGRLINKAILRVFNGSRSKKECERLGVAYYVAAETIKKNLEVGSIERTDNFYDESYGRFNRADDLIEAALRYCMDDAESIKSVCYGRFIGNIPYSNLSHRSLIALNKTINQLTYDELCLISAFNNRRAVKFDNLEQTLRTGSSQDMEAREFYVRILHLKSLGILAQTPYFHSGSAIGAVYLSEMGLSLFNLMELNLLDPNDVYYHASLINRFGLTA